MCMAKFKMQYLWKLGSLEKWTHARWKHIGKILKFKIFTPFQVSKRGEWGKLWELIKCFIFRPPHMYYIFSYTKFILVYKPYV